MYFDSPSTECVQKDDKLYLYLLDNIANDVLN